MLINNWNSVILLTFLYVFLVSICYETVCLSYLRESEKGKQDFENFKFEKIVKDPIRGPVFSFNKYYRLSEIYAFMEYLRFRYSYLVPEIIVIGRTWEDRSIKTLKISNGNANNTAIWIDGGMHAREWISVSSVYFIMYALLSNWDHLSSDLQNVDYYLTPVLNPDGYEYTHETKENRLWRKNRRKLDNDCYGVDLNRNFPYKWAHGHYTMQDDWLGGVKFKCGDVFGGEFPLSELESRAVTNFITKMENKFKGFVSFHSYGPAILYPYGYEPRVPKDVKRLNHVGVQAARKMLNATGLQYEVIPASMLGYSFAGNSLDWAYKIANIPYAYLVELRSETFVLPPSEIEFAAKEALIVVTTVVGHFHWNVDDSKLIFPKLFEEHKWQDREKQLLEENRKLSQGPITNNSAQKVKSLQAKLNTANEIINKLNENLSNSMAEWNKRETKLVEECNHLKCQIQNTPKMISPDVERIQEQLKDTQEMNVKIKLDFDTCKDKCSALETLCADLKKVIMDEQLAEKVYANDNIPTSVKTFLQSSSTSVINTLSHVFGCLSKSSSRSRYNSYSGQKDTMRRELFTTNESAMINDISRSFETTELFKDLVKDKEQLKKENMDLNRQVKELEKIVRRRAHSNFSNVSEIIREDSKQPAEDNEMVRSLKKELLDKQHSIIDLKNQLIESKAKYDQNLLTLQEKVVNIQEESIKLKDELEKKKNGSATAPNQHGPKCKRRGRTCDPPTPTARSFRIEISAKDKEIQTLTKQLDELKKTNRKLVRERGHYVSYLSSKEQSIDEIHLASKVGSAVNSEINSPDKAHVEFKCVKEPLKNGFSGGDTPTDPKETHEFSPKKKPNLCNGNANEENIVNGTDPGTGDNGDYNVLSEKLNHLEVKHQNLQQITCGLLSLLAKEGVAASGSDGSQKVSPESVVHNDELNRFVNALKDFNK